MTIRNHGDPLGLYRTLGLTHDTTATQIRGAYRALARRYHPDVAPGEDGHRFAQVARAYEVLGGARRAFYDRFARSWLPAGWHVAMTVQSPPGETDLIRQFRAFESRSRTAAGATSGPSPDFSEFAAWEAIFGQPGWFTCRGCLLSWRNLLLADSLRGLCRDCV